jgi:N-dimethylarginine dimethylaminohydrolase
MRDGHGNSTRARIAMCAPEHFEVTYTINPWMAPSEWDARRSELSQRSTDGWSLLVRKLESLGAEVELVPPQPGMPDLVFTANAAVVLDGVALVARFRHPERNVEEPHFRRFFDALKDRGLLREVHDMPAGVCLEGAGDCVHDGKRGIFYLGYGFRSDATAAPVVADLFREEVVALELVDPRFYHMDTCLCPLTNGEAMWVPEAFSATGRGILTERFGRHNLIEVPMADAAKLACNAVNLGTDIVLAEAGDALKGPLAERGYTVHEVPIRSFGLSGGSAWCLVLRLDRQSARNGHPPLQRNAA